MDTAGWDGLDNLLREFQVRVRFSRLAVAKSVTWRRVGLEGTFNEDSQVS